MSFKKLEFNLHSNQTVLTLSELDNLKALSPNESMSTHTVEEINTFTKRIVDIETNAYAVGSGITVFVASGEETYIKDAKTYEAGKRFCLQQPPSYTCHGKLNDLGRVGLNIFYNKFTFPTGSGSCVDNSMWILSLFEEDSPFVSVTKDVTFVTSTKGNKLVGVIFRDIANLDIHVFTNLLIWTRTITEFSRTPQLNALLALGFSKRECMALGPAVDSVWSEKDKTKLGFLAAGGDSPCYFVYQNYTTRRSQAVYLDYYKASYWPCDFVRGEAKGKGYKVSDPKVSWNPCNYVLSLHTFPKLRGFSALIFKDEPETTQPFLKFYNFFTSGKTDTKDIVAKLRQHFDTGEQIDVSK